MIHQLINGDWPEEEYLLVPPFHVTQGVYDLKQVIAAEAIPLENKACTIE
jgi:hypothetical protein